MTSFQFQAASESTSEDEYGCQFRRILPWDKSGPSDTGMGVSTIAPGGTTTQHSHEDYEQFYVVRGVGIAHVDEEVTPIGPGDAFVVRSNQTHFFTNASETDELELVSVWSIGPLGGVG